MDLRALPWLPPPPADFRQNCRAAATGGDLRRLALHAIDVSQSWQLARALDRLTQGGEAELAPLRPFRLGVLSNATTDLMAAPLVAAGLRHGLAIEVIATEYGQVLQDATNPHSAIHQARPDAVLLALDHRGLPLRPAPGQDDAAMVAAALHYVGAIRAGIAAGCGAPVIVQTLARPADSLFGSLDWVLPGTLRRLVAGVNDGLAAMVRGTPDMLLDVAHLAETVGLAYWHDHTQWHTAKQPFAVGVLPLWADHLARLLAAMRGLARKCLVLDLDNTLWGGVIGDDGLEGIRLGQGDAVGEAFLAVQRAALDLRGRGIVLAICSKNDEDKARAPFRDHPDMLLGEQDIAVFQANWVDKPTNLKAIARTLNIGTDALVFLDDNPAERAIVRRELPEVAVPELADDPSCYAPLLLAAGYFEAVAFSDDDASRAEQYQANARRAVLEHSATDMDAYLTSLTMVIHFAPFDGPGRARIAQLINKSNQFNLTTRRYTEAEVAAWAADGAAFTLQVRLRDAFGDNGMIGVVICRPGDLAASWEVDTWLMSCRVLGRRVEQAVLNEIAAAARSRGIRTVIGRYLASSRNQMVADHYPQLGFAPAGEAMWQLDIDAFTPYPVPMQVEHS